MSTFQIMQWAFLAAVFVIVFITVLKTLKEASSFQNGTAAVLAFCVSVLCAVGLAQFIEIPGLRLHAESPAMDPGNPLYYFLLPYVALTMAVLMSQLLALAGKILPETKSKRQTAHTKATTKTGKRRGRPRKQRPKTNSRESQVANTQAQKEAHQTTTAKPN